MILLIDSILWLLFWDNLLFFRILLVVKNLVKTRFENLLYTKCDYCIFVVSISLQTKLNQIINTKHLRLCQYCMDLFSPF